MKPRKKASLYIPKDPNIWQTKDGRQVPIADMDTQHLRNALAYVDRKLENKRKEYAETADMYYNNSMPDKAEQILDEGMKLSPQKFCPQYDALQEELNKRDELARQTDSCPF